MTIAVTIVAITVHLQSADMLDCLCVQVTKMDYYISIVSFYTSTLFSETSYDTLALKFFFLLRFISARHPLLTLVGIITLS